jgi:hypothetical protein
MTFSNLSWGFLQAEEIADMTGLQFLPVTIQIRDSLVNSVATLFHSHSALLDKCIYSSGQIAL